MGGLPFSSRSLRRWLPRCPSPDFVTIWFGGNDWSDGARRARFAERLRLAVDVVRRRTRGSADLLLMSPPPSLEEWDSEIYELGEAARAVAAEKNTAFVDACAIFREAGQEEAKREALFAWDKVHLGEYGHQVTAEAVFAAVKSEEEIS
jgi:lysophospholipase L1-like esterase